MGWIKVEKKTLKYADRVEKPEGFDEWSERELKDLIESIAREKGFALLGRRRAKNELWKDLEKAITSNALRAAIQAEAEDYPRLLARIADKAKGLPSSEDFRPPIAVPRFILNRMALDTVTDRLGKSDELNRLKGGAVLKEYFFNQLIRELDAALTSIQPTPKKPFVSEGEWLIVGIDRVFNWGPVDWPGHYYLYKAFKGKISRSDRKEVERRLRGLAAFLGRMSLDEKSELLRGVQIS